MVDFAHKELPTGLTRSERATSADWWFGYLPANLLHLHQVIAAPIRLYKVSNSRVARFYQDTASNQSSRVAIQARLRCRITTMAARRHVSADANTGCADDLPH